MQLLTLDNFHGLKISVHVELRVCLSIKNGKCRKYVETVRLREGLSVPLIASKATPFQRISRSLACIPVDICWLLVVTE